MIPPMSDRLNEQQVRDVAKLSRLRLSDEEVHHFAGQLSRVLEYMSKLSELNLDGIEPLAHPIDMTNVLREDTEQAGLSVETALANAPAKMTPFFEVPKVLGDGAGA
jgi:aspartyl-tRNA(Asn)/glutamyl-tRNA(Gln) amidotransferase subunit C